VTETETVDIAPDLTLSTLKDGALEERFQACLAEIFADINDPNKPADSLRYIDVRLVFRPDGDRDLARYAIDKCEAKLAKRTPRFSKIHAMNRGGSILVFEHDPHQTSFDTTQGEPVS